jgi:hypothetical protein
MFSIWTPLPEAGRPLTPEDGNAQGEDKADGASAEALPPMTKD